MIPLYHSDLFVKENVGTDEQISDLKKQILDARDDDRGAQPGSMRVVGDLMRYMKCSGYMMR